MKFFRSKKRMAVLVALVVVAVSAAAAYAYFTTAGSGTGTFSSGQVGSVSVTSDAAGPLYPQTSPANTTPLTIHVTNNGSGSQYIGAISGVIHAASLPVGCNPGWFTIASATAPGLVAAGQTVTASSSIILNDNGGNQNACANTTFQIDWTSAAG